MVAQFPRLDKMRDSEEGAEHDADSSHDYVGDAQEGVLTAHYGAGADYDGLCAAVFGDVEICMALGGAEVKSGERTYGGQCLQSIFPQSSSPYHCAG